MAAMLPILSYMGVSAFNLPTALVSNTLNYGRFNILETTDYMRGVLPVWQELGFRFDAVCTGLMFSEDQARLVADYCRELREQGTTIFVDPVMGDAGELYNGIKDSGANFIGSVETDGYTFDDSEAVIDGKFIGLPLDDINEDDQTDTRIDAWLAAITPSL
jgi:hypothetical protein